MPLFPILFPPDLIHTSHRLGKAYYPMNLEMVPGAGSERVPPFGIHQEIIYESNSEATSRQSLPHTPSISNHSTTSDQQNTQLTKIPGDPILINESVNKFLYSQLSVQDLNDIHRYLWLAAQAIRYDHQLLYKRKSEYLRHGRISKHNKIHPLHQQLVMCRKIMITENPCLHLCRTHTIIYIKPLPPYLLQWKFFKENICPDKELYGHAIGFMSTYVHLVRNRSDFKIALDLGLMPEKTTWTAWSSLATTLANTGQESMSRRYDYGELNIRRINLIYFFYGGNMPYAFFSREDRWYARWFTSSILVFAFLSITLSAMQVVLATNGNPTVDFETVSYGFSMFAIVAVIVSVGVMVIWGLIVFASIFFMLLHKMLFLREKRGVVVNSTHQV